MRVCMLAMMLSFSLLADPCSSLFDKRGESLQSANQAINCYSSNRSSVRVDKANSLNNLSYLYFIKATLHKSDSLKSLRTSYGYAKEAINLYTPMFNYSSISSLNSREKKSLALAYYFYGTSVSKYVDLKGKFEAIKRMGEIKKSMKAILRLKEKETFHYGAYRTLAIFYYKVPAIAGGSYEKSKSYFEKLMTQSILTAGVSSYPVNHLYYADFLFKYGKKTESCSELRKMINIDETMLEQEFKSLYHETKNDIEEAKKVYKRRNC